MAASSQALKTLHELHQKLNDVQEELARGPRQTSTRNAAVEKRQTELEARRQKLKLLKVTADQKNLQLKTNEAKIAELRAKLNLATSNREYEILNGQIEADRMANSVLEDEILEALTKIDQSQGEVKQAEMDLAAAQGDLQKVLAEVQAREPGLTERVRALEAEVASAEKVLPGEIVSQYRRAVQAYRADALAAVVNRTCTSCNMQLTMQKVVELGSGKLMFCSCGRLLYLPDKS
jgi:predicted  nucleic acid-binding Zn-ribbon protein